MYKLRPRDERGITKNSWLESYHTFSFGQYFDPHYMGFSDLRVINDDIIAPQKGFDFHRHDNMEIMSIVLSGELEHKDNMGNTSVIRPGEIQRMCAGTGVVHSEYNPSTYAPVHFLQIWVLPDKTNYSPEYEQKQFDSEKMLNKLYLIISPDGRDDSMKMHQDIEIYQTLLEYDRHINYVNDEKRKLWIQVALGAVEVNSNLLQEGDGFAFSGEISELDIIGVDEQSNILLFNLRNE